LIAACGRTWLDIPDLAQTPQDAGGSRSTGGAADASPTGEGALPAPDGAASIDATAGGSADAAPGSTSSDASSTVADGAVGAQSAIASSFLLNPAHTNAVVSPTLTPPLTRIWSVDFQMSLASYPLIAGGLVYFVMKNAGYSNALVALDEHTGATRWGPIDLHTLYASGHAYDAGRVFVTSTNDGVVRAFDAATGAALWTQSVGASTSISTPPTAYRGILYVATGSVVAIDEATGAILWTGPGGVDMGSPAVTDDGVFVSYGCGLAAHAFDRVTGARLWDFGFPCDGAGAAAPAVFEGRLYMLVSPGSGNNIVLDVHTGANLGSYPAISFPAFDDHRLFCNLRSPLEAVDLATGATQWTFNGDGNLNLGPVVANGTVYVVSDDGAMFGADEATGAEVWSTKVAAQNAPGSTAAAEGVLVTTWFSQAFGYAHDDVPDAGVNAVDSSADGACSGGEPCLLPAEVLARGETGPNGIALDAQNVYWTNYGSGEVRKVAKSGGPPVTLYAAKNTNPWGIAVDANNVYWTLPNFYFGGLNWAVMSMPLVGGAATTLVSKPSGPTPTAIAVSATDVFWTEAGPALWTVPIAGGVATALAMGSGGQTIAIDKKNVYWVMDGAIQMAPLSGGAPVPIGPSAAAIAVDATDVYFVNSDQTDVGGVSRVPIGGGTPTVLASGRSGSLAGVAVDDANVYWIEGEGTIQQGAVAAVPKSGGHVTILASGLGDPSAIALDDSGVYFTNPAALGGGQIMRVPKR
jgi:outer membrane protein assembly factor BamB